MKAIETYVLGKVEKNTTVGKLSPLKTRYSNLSHLNRTSAVEEKGVRQFVSVQIVGNNKYDLQEMMALRTLTHHALFDVLAKTAGNYFANAVEEEAEKNLF